eukprot:12284177-Alexandrium_andersonii.AAC.1
MAQEPAEDENQDAEAERQDTRLPAPPSPDNEEGPARGHASSDQHQASPGAPAQGKLPPWGHLGPPPAAWAPPAPPGDE